MMRTLLIALGVTGLAVCGSAVGAATEGSAPNLGLLPYPQQVTMVKGRAPVGPAHCTTVGKQSDTVRVAIETLDRHLPKSGKAMEVRLGSLEEGYDPGWIAPDEKEFLARESTSPEASVLHITADVVTVVGKGRMGMLYGAQTINQLAIEAARKGESSLPCLSIRDWPDMRWRCLSPTLTWYSGYNRLEGYDLCNWTEDEWKWLADWSLLHKCNAWAVCMYGYWPFTVPGHESNSLDVDSFRYNPKTGKKESYRFTHKNIQKEFLPELIRYANDRGVQVHAYIGKNSFNGTYWISHPEMNGGGAAELLPFAPGVHEYWDAMIRRILQIGFNGFVFEDPEAYHVPNQNAECYKTFWEPWAKTYGFNSVAETDQNKPPLGVHIEYYAWLFKQFDDMISHEAKALGRKGPVDIYLISHILLSRLVNESKTPEERDRWLALVDEKQGRKVPFVIFEGDEKKYVNIFGNDRVASLGGRGGSCTCAMRRIASVNNDWSYGSMGASVDYERDCQRRIFQAGGFGAMGYIFEWTNTEVFGYIAAQHLWKHAGVPGIDNENQTGFLDYAYRAYYGDKVGAVVAQAFDASACVNDAMVLDGVAGSQFPETGRPLHRDYQYLAAQSDRAWELARKAYKLYTGHEPDLRHPAYDEAKFQWNGYDPVADKLFKTERLRLLCVSAERCRLMCEAALAHRLSQRLIAEGATVDSVLAQFDRAITAAKENEHLYQINYDDDYDWTDGLCSKLTERMESLKKQLLLDCGGKSDELKSWVFDRPDDPLGWTWTNDVAAPTVESHALVVRATGPDCCFSQTTPFSVEAGKRAFVEIEMNSDKAGRGRLFWAAPPKDEASGKVYPFSESRVVSFEVNKGDHVYRLFPSWDGTVSGLRIDIPAASTVRISSIRIHRMPAEIKITEADLRKPVSESARRSAAAPLFIPWEKLTDIVPKSGAAKQPGAYLSVDLGLDRKADLYRIGVTYTVQAQTAGEWRTIFRRSIDRRSTGWEHWDVPLPADGARVRLMTDSYSRAQDRSAPSWMWALWGRPEIVRIGEGGQRTAVQSLADHVGEAKAFVRLDSDGKERPFDGKGEDSTGAAFRAVSQSRLEKLRQSEGKDWQWVEGFADWTATPPHNSPYRCYLGTPPSGWAYAHESGEVAWKTESAVDHRETAVAFIAGTDYSVGDAELWCDGKHLLDFRTGSTSDASWQKDGVELRFLFGGDTRDERTTYGLSGVFVLRLPESMITPGKPLDLKVVPKTGSNWFMLHAYKSTFEASRGAAVPEPSEPTIAAYTPHINGKFGVTIGEFEIR